MPRGPAENFLGVLVRK